MCRGAPGLPEWVPQTDCDWQKSVGRERNSGTASPEAQKNRQHADFEFHRGSRKKTAALTRDLNSDVVFLATTLNLKHSWRRNSE